MKLEKDQKILKHILDKYINRNEKIIDVGCGVGRNLKLLNSLGYSKIWGTDISKEMSKIARNLGFSVLSEKKLKNNQFLKFDVLLFSHILEHVDEKEIQPFLEKYFRLLKKIAK